MIGAAPGGGTPPLLGVPGVFQFVEKNRERSGGYTDETLCITNIDFYWNTGTLEHPIISLSWGFALLNMISCNVHVHSVCKIGVPVFHLFQEAQNGF